MAKQLAHLTPGNPNAVIHTPWQAAGVTVFNPTPYTVYIRSTSADVPHVDSYNYAVPPATSLNIPVSGSDFGFALSTAPLINTPSTLGNTVAVIVYDGRENPPAVGGNPFATLSASDDLGGPWTVGPANAYVGPFDLDNWGGLLVTLTGVSVAWWTRALVQTSHDLVTWVDANDVPVWEGETFTLSIPRVSRYVRLFIETGPPEGSVTRVMARLTSAEILAFSNQRPQSTFDMYNWPLIPESKITHTINTGRYQTLSLSLDIGPALGQYNVTFSQADYNGSFSTVGTFILPEGAEPATVHIPCPMPLTRLSLGWTGLNPTVTLHCIARLLDEYIPLTTDLLSASHSSINVGVVSTSVLPVRSGRQYLALTNTGAFPCYIAVNATAIAGNGILLQPGDSWELSRGWANLSSLPVNAIAVGGITTLARLEY